MSATVASGAYGTHNEPADTPNRVAVAAAYACGGVVVLGLGHFLLGSPVQVSDSFGNLLKVGASWQELAFAEFSQRAFLRPMLWLELKAVYELSSGNYSTWFRGTHVVQVVALVALYLHLIRPRRWADAAMVPFGLAVLIGHHSFAGTVTEAFPINTFLTIVLCCLTAAALSLGRWRWWHDPAAVLLFSVAALTVESGLLVWVVIAGAALVGARGVSKAGLVAVTLALGGYFLLRFALLDVGSPALTERASGFGFSVLEPEQLSQRFGANPWPFYAYNVLTSLMSVLTGEPRSGVFRLVHGVTLGAPYPQLVANALACTLASTLVAAHAWSRRAAWRQRSFSRDDQLVLIFVVVAAANAVIGYPYSKDVIMSPAGAFFAVAVFAAARGLMSSPRAVGSRGLVALAVLAVVIGSAWSLRVWGVHVELRVAALRVRHEWAYVDEWIAQQRLDVSTPRAAALRRTLRSDALFKRPAPSELAATQMRVFY